jgi:hypothetical protein
VRKKVVLDNGGRIRPILNVLVRYEVSSEHDNTNIYNKNADNNEKIADQNDQKGSQSPTDVSQASHVSPTTAEQFQCYYCDSFKTNSNDDYEGHTIMKHGQGHPCYPSKADLEKLELKAQGKRWEI